MYVARRKVRAGKVVISQGYGLADRTHQVANTPHTKFRIGSITKLLEESLVLGRELGDRRGVAHVLNKLGDVARGQGDYSRAMARYEESLCLF